MFSFLLITSHSLITLKLLQKKLHPILLSQRKKAVGLSYIRQHSKIFLVHCLTYTHCAFSSNLFHGQIAQIYINHLSGHENKKVALECHFWADVILRQAITDTHCAFSSNLFHGQIAQIYIDHLSGHENENVALEKLMNRPPSNPATFEQERT